MTRANQIVVLPDSADGTLVNVMARLFLSKDGAIFLDRAAIFSHNKGKTWSKQPVAFYRSADNITPNHITDNNPDDSQATGVPLRAHIDIHDAATTPT